MSTRLVRLRRLAIPFLAVGLGLAAVSAADAQELGIDVSSHQHHGAVNWTQVRAHHVTFAFIKATEGTGYTNPYFASDWAGAARAGILRGAYHYARPSSGSAVAQAGHFAAQVGALRQVGVLPPVLDLETTGGLAPDALRAWTRTWLVTVGELTGRTPIIYTTPRFWEHHVGGSGFSRYPLWVAHYGVSQPRVPAGWPYWTFWQGTSVGHVAGISGNVDLDAFNGDHTHLLRFAHPAP